MTAKYFVDTNVLIYAGSNAVEDQAKRQIARSILGQSDIAFSAGMPLFSQKESKQDVALYTAKT